MHISASKKVVSINFQFSLSQTAVFYKHNLRFSRSSGAQTTKRRVGTPTRLVFAT